MDNPRDIRNNIDSFKQAFAGYQYKNDGNS